LGFWVDVVTVFAVVIVALLIGSSPLLLLLNWGSVVANNYALALAHASGGSNCKGRGISQGL
jgi:hypothetical protein